MTENDIKKTKKEKPEQQPQQPDTAPEQPKEEVKQETQPAQDDQVKKLTEENAQLKDQLLRKMAEFDNFRKRTAREKEELAAHVKAGCAEPIISLIDNFERALSCPCSDTEFYKGIQMLSTQFSDMLKNLGIEEIEALGKPFDPNLHNAVNQVQDDQYPENTVCQVFQKGYKMGDKVVRHAMVVVANP